MFVIDGSDTDNMNSYSQESTGCCRPDYDDLYQTQRPTRWQYRLVRRGRNVDSAINLSELRGVLKEAEFLTSWVHFVSKNATAVRN